MTVPPRPRQPYRSVTALAVVVCITFIFLGLLLMYKVREWHPRRNVDFGTPTYGLFEPDVVAEVYNEIENGRARTERELSILMQKRIDYLQNPANCTSAKKLLCSFVNNPCGFACLIHQVVFCFIMAYATERTVVIDAAGWIYTSEGWETAFLPVSKCTIAGTKPLMELNEHNMQSSETLFAPVITNRFQLSQAPIISSIPSDLFDQSKYALSYPFGWFIGQFLKYAMQPNPRLVQYIQEGRRELNLGLHQPLVGLQIRLTDKVTTREGASHSLENYMSQVVEWFDREAHNISGIAGRNVYLATDEPTVFTEAQKNYPQYNFIRKKNLAHEIAQGARYSSESLYGILFDMLILSECDFVVCTFSSNICRLVYELMMIRDPDAIYRIHSLDTSHYLVGNFLYAVANESHIAKSTQELSFSSGDRMRITGQRRDGWSMGVRDDNGKRGLFPSQKVKQQIVVADFPTYNNITLL